MNANWLPAFIVLAVGLGGGLLFALRWIRLPTAKESRSVGGFFYGFAAAAILGLLIVGATRNAEPRAESSASTLAGSTIRGSAEGGPQESATAHDAAGSLSSIAALRLEPLRTRLAADPNDHRARKQLAVMLLAENQLFEAFEQAGELLRVDPEDPDGLYVRGVVRLAMGQGRKAVELLDPVVARYPDHVAAWSARGKAYLKSGNLPMAIASWERGLNAAGGRHAELEPLLDRARQGQSVAEILAAVGSRPRQPRLAAGGDPAAFRMRVELAPGAEPEPGATLFAALRPATGGPPAAVKKVLAPSFPLELTLGPEDAMMGLPFPAIGTLSVRLDSDGNASTVAASDATAEAEAAGGSTTQLVLGG